MNQRITLTPAPGAVFLRASKPVVEMTPAEALQVAEQLRDLARVALAAQDGVALRGMIGDTHA